MDVFTILRRNDLTSGLTDDECKQLANLSHLKHVPKEQVVVKEGEQSSDLYIIGRGRVGIFLYSVTQPGALEKIATLIDNELFGEFSMIDGSRRSATVIAEEDTDLIYIDNLALQRFLNDHEHIGYLFYRNLAKILTKKLRNTDLEIRNALL
jgi:CRP-like cAMP-binding protein